MWKAGIVAKWVVILMVATCGILPTVSLAKQHHVAPGESLVIDGHFENQEGMLPAEIQSYIISGNTTIRITLSSAPKPPFTVRIYLNNEAYQNEPNINQAADGSLDCVFQLLAEKLKPGKNTIFVNVLATNGQIGQGKARVRLQHKTKSK